MSIFNEDYIEDAAKACQYLSILRPELIVPPIMKKLFLSIDNITEPGRFTLIMKCLPGIICQIVRQTSNYSEGQTYVLTLMMSILPCIDSNDFEKIAVTLEVLDAILKLVPCIDCSSAIHTRNDLTEIEKRVCLSTTQFEDFITDFLNRIFQMISIRSAEMFDDAVANDVFNEDDKFIQIIHQKIIKFLTGSLFSSKVRKFVAGLVRVIIKVNPIEILKYLLPQTCEHIENIMNNSQTAILMDHKGDIELTWHLVLFSELVRARGDALLIYKQMIMSVFHQCIRIVHKDSYEAIAKAAKHLLKSLSDLYSIDDQLSLENMDESFVDCLPIRAWGQHVDFDQLQVQYHFPTVDEIDFACEFVNTFIYAELQLLNEKCLNLSKEERLRSLTLIHYIAVGCLRMVSRIESNQVIDLVPTVVPYGSKYRFRYSIYSKEPKFRDNLRMRLLIDIGNLLDILVENHCDDVASINTAINIYALLPIYYGISQYDINKLCQYIGLNEALFKTWGQHQISMSLMCLLLQKRVPIPLSCIRTLVDFIVHDNIELRKYAVIGMTALCRLQKPPRVYVEKSLDEILRHENQDPRRMHRLIDFLCSLIKNNQTIESASNERFRWRLVQELRNFQWRIPLVWCAINNFAKELLDHPFEIVRENIANILSMSLSFDIILPNGRSTRHPNIDQFINTICERLHQAIVAYEKTPFVPVNVSNQVVEIDFETRKALNLMETVIQLHTYLFDWCQQPVKIATIRIFPYVSL
ncbi:unnamed protein product [Rotaria sordida]|uniref:Proteasome activator Blm10 middle HEAT repeats region domain-containing protein n=1 Tax=Rotaria sordida TaxID=392033 RepID=A0A819JXV5_9BILA|nr:unnamed protein product [Rotaria sordida]